MDPEHDDAMALLAFVRANYRPVIGFRSSMHGFDISFVVVQIWDDFTRLP